MSSQILIRSKNSLEQLRREVLERIFVCDITNSYSLRVFCWFLLILTAADPVFVSDYAEWPLRHCSRWVGLPYGTKFPISSKCDLGTKITVLVRYRIPTDHRPLDKPREFHGTIHRILHVQYDVASSLEVPIGTCAAHVHVPIHVLD